MGAAESDEFFGNADVTFRGGLSRFFPGRTRPDFGISVLVLEERPAKKSKLFISLFKKTALVTSIQTMESVSWCVQMKS